MLRGAQRQMQVLPGPFRTGQLRKFGGKAKKGTDRSQTDKCVQPGTIEDVSLFVVTSHQKVLHSERYEKC